MSHKKLFRLYQEEGLAVKRRKGRKRALGSRAEMPTPDQPGDRWSLDFVSDMNKFRSNLTPTYSKRASDRSVLPTG